jgi:hypothetical protein
MTKTPEAFLAEVPSREELRRRIAANLNERQLLRTLLKIAEKRDATHQAKGGAAR